MIIPASDTDQPAEASAMSPAAPAHAALLHLATTPGCGKWTSALSPETCALTRASPPPNSAPPLATADAAPAAGDAAAGNGD